jgi:hypothetical protein
MKVLRKVPHFSYCQTGYLFSPYNFSASSAREGGVGWALTYTGIDMGQFLCAGIGALQFSVFILFFP